MFSDLQSVPRCIWNRLFRVGLLLLLVTVLSIVVTVLSHDIFDLFLGGIIVIVGLIHILNVIYAVKQKNICFFEGTCIDTSSKNDVKNFARGILTGEKIYMLQNESQTVEIVAKGSLYLHGGQKYRFYLPDGSLNCEGKEILRLHQFYGFEMI